MEEFSRKYINGIRPVSSPPRVGAGVPREVYTRILKEEMEIKKRCSKVLDDCYCNKEYDRQNLMGLCPEHLN